MENVTTNWCESRHKSNFGIIWAVSGPPGSPTQQKKNFLWPIVKACTVLRDVLAKTLKIILRNKEKGHFVPFSAHYSAQRDFFKEKFQRNSNGNQDAI